MVELRWVTPEGTTTSPARLQWRTREQDPWGRWTLWGKWAYVPVAVIPRNGDPLAEAPPSDNMVKTRLQTGRSE